MKALITGGAGFIGLHLAKILLENDLEVHLIDNFARAVEDKDLESLLKNEKCSLIKLDLLSRENYEKLDKDYDFIFHLAAIIGVQHVLNRPYDVLTCNVQLLENIISFSKDQKNLKRFLFASTSEIYAGTLKYGDLQIPTPETSKLTLTKLEEPRTTYLLSKIYGEAMCQHSGLPFTIFRPHNFYGPRMGMSHVIPEMLKKAYTFSEEEVITAFSSNHTRTFCYIEDAVNMIWEISKSSKCEGQVFNIGNEDPEVSILTLAEKIVKCVGRKVLIEPGEETAGSPSRRCPMTTKLEGFIDYRAKWSLDEGIKDTFDWYRKNVFENNGITAQ